MGWAYIAGLLGLSSLPSFPSSAIGSPSLPSPDDERGVEARAAWRWEVVLLLFTVTMHGAVGEASRAL